MAGDVRGQDSQEQSEEDENRHRQELLTESRKKKPDKGHIMMLLQKTRSHRAQLIRADQLCRGCYGALPMSEREILRMLILFCYCRGDGFLCFTPFVSFDSPSRTDVTSKPETTWPPWLQRAWLKEAHSDSDKMSYDYQEGLPVEARTRYLAKLELVGVDKCPFKEPADAWTNNPKQWPTLEYHDVYNYLIKSPRKFKFILWSFFFTENYNAFLCVHCQSIGGDNR